MSLKSPRKDPMLIEDPMSKWSVRLLAVASAVAGLETQLPALQAIMPPHWYAYAFPAILVARIVKQAVNDK